MRNLEKVRRHSFVRFQESLLRKEAEAGRLSFLTEGERRFAGEFWRWVKEGFPFVVRRPCWVEDRICVGLALPPAEGKLRLAWELPIAAVEEVILPPRWEEFGEEGRLRGVVDALRGRGEGEELAFRVFGSYAWERLTGLSYTHEESDVDLLLFLDGREEWERGRKFLEKVVWPEKPRVDLEIVLRGDGAFLWREFLDKEPKSLLFKGNTRVWMGSKEDVWRGVVGV